MKTFNELATDYTTLSRDDSTANLALGKSLMNRFLSKILVARDWTFNRSSFTDKSVADQQNYPLPYNCWRIRSIKVTVGTLNYFPKEVMSREIWTNLNRTVVTSDAAQKFFVENDHVEIYPVSATDDNNITMYFQKLVKTLEAADHTAGLITVATPEATEITATPVAAFASAMVGRFIKPTGDGYWYEISAVSSPTSLTIKREARIAITNGAYTISEIIPLPWGFQDIPLWWALTIYFQAEEDPIQAREYERMCKEGIIELLRRDAKSTGQVLEKSDLEEIVGLIDVNKYPQDMS